MRLGLRGPGSGRGDGPVGMQSCQVLLQQMCRIQPAGPPDTGLQADSSMGTASQVQGQAKGSHLPGHGADCGVSCLSPSAGPHSTPGTRRSPLPMDGPPHCCSAPCSVPPSPGPPTLAGVCPPSGLGAGHPAVPHHVARMLLLLLSRTRTGFRGLKTSSSLR